jgi:hypothetical protein
MVRLSGIFNQTAFCSEVLRGMVDTTFAASVIFVSSARWEGVVSALEGWYE